MNLEENLIKVFLLLNLIAIIVSIVGNAGPYYFILGLIGVILCLWWLIFHERNY